MQTVIRSFLVLLCFITTDVAAEPMSVYGSTGDADGTSAVNVRAGAGSLFGPAFDAGQPTYAHSDGFEWENRRPFSTPHQIVTTYGLSASLMFALGRWSIGPTVGGGFNTARSRANDFSAINLADSMSGATFGTGVQLARGRGPLRLTVDVLGSYSALRGEVEWSYSDLFGSDTLVGTGEWQTSYIRFAALAGVELDLAPLFLFVNAGAQFLPRQERPYRVSGSFPEAHERAFNVAVVSKVNEGISTVEFADELSFAASAGLGLRF